VEFDDTVRATLATIGPLVAQSLERARVPTISPVAAERNARLGDLSEALAVAGASVDVVRVMCERLAAPIGAVEAIVGVIDPTGGRLLCTATIAGSNEPLALSRTRWTPAGPSWWLPGPGEVLFSG